MGWPRENVAPQMRINDNNLLHQLKCINQIVVAVPMVFQMTHSFHFRKIHLIKHHLIDAFINNGKPILRKRRPFVGKMHAPNRRGVASLIPFNFMVK